MATDYDLDRAANYGRERDRAMRIECDLPPAGPAAPRDAGPTPGDLDRAFGIGQRPTSAAQERRVRDTWRR